MPRKQIDDMIEELRSWLPNYDHGPKDYPILLFRILARMPGGDELEDMGYETFNLGWHEMEQLARVLDAIQDKRDVEDLVHGLTYEEEEDIGEARKRPFHRGGPEARERGAHEARPAQVHSALRGRTRETPGRRPAPKARAKKAPAKKAPRRKKTPTRRRR